MELHRLTDDQLRRLGKKLMPLRMAREVACELARRVFKNPVLPPTDMGTPVWNSLVRDENEKPRDIHEHDD